MKNTFLPFLAVSTACILLTSSCKKTEDNPGTPAPNNPGAPSLLSDAVTGDLFATGNINDFTLAANSGNVVLLAANNTTGEVYAVDIKDNNAAEATENTITGQVSGVGAQIAAQMGIAANQISILNMEVNPLSKSVYVLALNRQSNATALFKLTKAGTVITKVNFTNVTYSAIKFSNGSLRVNDMTWGDNTLFFSLNNSSTLNGEVTSVQAPFAHNTNTVNRATTVFKTNWGNQFFTDAPLETMAYGEVDGEKRLMGLTVCAPGYSFKTSEVSGSGLLQVNEYFNLAGESPIKVITATQNNTTYLVEFHQNGRIARVGEKYINGSQTSINASAKYLLQFGSGARTTGLTDEDVKILATAGNHVIIAKLSDTALLVMKSDGSLDLLAI